MSRPDRYFGIIENLSGIGDGIIANSYNETNSVQSAEARDEYGRLLNLHPYSESRQVTIDGLFVGEGLKAGQKVHIGDRDYLVTSNAKNESNQDFVRSNVSLQGGDEETVVGELSANFQS